MPRGPQRIRHGAVSREAYADLIRLLRETVQGTYGLTDDAAVRSIELMRDRLATTSVDRSLRSEPLLAKARHAIAYANDAIRFINAEKETSNARTE